MAKLSEMKLSELKKEFFVATNYSATPTGVELWIDSLGKTKEDVLQGKSLGHKATWVHILQLIALGSFIDNQKQPEEEELEKNVTSPSISNPALQAIAIEEKEQRSDRVASRQCPVLETIEQDNVTIEPPPPKKKGRKITPRIKSYAINGNQSNDFLFQNVTYKLQIVGDNVALMRYANNCWRINCLLGKITELKFEKDYWYILANGSPQARKLANTLYHNPNISRADLAHQFDVTFKTFDIPNGLVEYVEYVLTDYGEGTRKTVTLKRVNKIRTEYQFYPSSGVYQKSKLHKTAIEKTEQWLRHLSTNELTGLPVRFKFKKQRRNGSYKYVTVAEEVVNVYKTLTMLTEGKRGKKDLGYYLVRSDTIQPLSDIEMKELAHQIAITGDRTRKGYLTCFSWSGCATSEQLIWRVLQGFDKLLPRLAFVDENGDLIQWSDSVTALVAWLEVAKKDMPDYVKWTFDTDTINQFAHWLQHKATEATISYEYRFKVVSLHQSCPAHLLQYYGDLIIKDFLSLAKVKP